jgi:hypothetical protein
VGAQGDLSVFNQGEALLHNYHLRICPWLPPDGPCEAAGACWQLRRAVNPPLNDRIPRAPDLLQTIVLDSM